MPSAFDYQKFSEIVNASSNKYQEQFPYPFMYLDDLFDSNLIDDINKEIDVGDFKLDDREIDSVEIKTRSDFSDNESIPKYSKIIFEILNGGKFLEIVTSLTGIKGLVSDPYYDGGGINIIKNNGTLAVHVDGTTQHRMNLCRRINAILFCVENSKNQVDVFNIGNEDQIDVLNIGSIICESLGLENVKISTKGGTIDGRGWIGDIKNMQLDISKVSNLGWSPKLNSKQSVEKASKEIIYENKDQSP